MLKVARAGVHAILGKIPRANPAPDVAGRTALEGMRLTAHRHPPRCVIARILVALRLSLGLSQMPEQAQRAKGRRNDVG